MYVFFLSVCLYVCMYACQSVCLFSFFISVIRLFSDQICIIKKIFLFGLSLVCISILGVLCIFMLPIYKNICTTTTTKSAVVGI